jgi:hypothetical protein
MPNRLMSGISRPRLGIGPLIFVKTSVSDVRFSSRNRSWLAGWCGRQIVLKPWPVHVPGSCASGPRGSAGWPPTSGTTSGIGGIPSKTKLESVSTIGATVASPEGSFNSYALETEPKPRGPGDGVNSVTRRAAARRLLVEDQRVRAEGEEHREQAPRHGPAHRAEERRLPVTEAQDVDEDPQQQDRVARDCNPRR